MTEKTFEIIKVTNRKAERNGNFPPPLNVGKIKKKAISFKRLNKDTWEKLLGNEGWMSVEDKDKGNYAPYGIDPKKMETAQKVVILEKDNAELAKKVAELEAELQSKIEPPKTDPKKEQSQNNNEWNSQQNN